MRRFRWKTAVRLSAWTGSLSLLALATLPAHTLAQETDYESKMGDFEVTYAAPEALEHFRAGMWEWDNVDAAAAAEHFEAALAVDPSFGAARVMHAGAAPGMSTDDRVQQIAYGMMDMARGTTVEQLLALALKESVSGNAATAAMLVEAASELAPEAPHLAYRQAVWSGGSTEAMKEVANRFPDFAPAWNNIAYNLYGEGKTEEAVAAVTKYMELAPDHPNAHDSYAEIMQWEGDAETARAHYRKAVELRPSYVAAYQGIAETEWLLGNKRDARAALERSGMYATTEFARLNARRAIAASYMMEGKRAEAESGFAGVASAATSSGNRGLARNAHYQAALNDAINGNGKSVSTHLARAAELGGSGTLAHDYWGAMAYALARDAEAAGAMATSLAEAAPEGAAGAVRIAKAHVMLAKGDGEGALSLLADDDDSLIMVRALRARAYKATGQGGMARELQESVLSDPNFAFTNALATTAIAQVRKM